MTYSHPTQLIPNPSHPHSNPRTRRYPRPPPTRRHHTACRTPTRPTPRRRIRPASIPVVPPTLGLRLWQDVYLGRELLGYAAGAAGKEAEGWEAACEIEQNG